MLNGVPAFMGRHGSRGDAFSIIYIGTQVHRLVHRIVMIAQDAVYRGDLYVINAIFLEHF